MKMVITGVRITAGGYLCLDAQATAYPYKLWQRLIHMDSIVQAEDPTGALAHEISILLAGPKDEAHVD